MSDSFNVYPWVSYLPVGETGRARSRTISNQPEVTTRRQGKRARAGRGTPVLHFSVQTPGQDPTKTPPIGVQPGGPFMVPGGKEGLVHLGACVACYVFIFVVSAIISVFTEERRRKATCAGAAEA